MLELVLAEVIILGYELNSICEFAQTYANQQNQSVYKLILSISQPKHET